MKADSRTLRYTIFLFSILSAMLVIPISLSAENAINQPGQSGSDSIKAAPMSITSVDPALKPDPFVSEGVLGHFTWGVDLGSGVDVTSRNMTMFSLGAEFGYKGGPFRMIGFGAEIFSMMDNSSRAYPIFAIVRTSFTTHPTLCFLDVRGGISINNILDSKQQTGWYGSLGVGFNLANKRSFASHIILRGIAMPFKGVYEETYENNFKYTMGYACISIGCAF